MNKKSLSALVLAAGLSLSVCATAASGEFCETSLSLFARMTRARLLKKITSKRQWAWGARRGLADHLFVFREVLADELLRCGPEQKILVLGSGEGVFDEALATQRSVLNENLGRKVIRYESCGLGIAEKEIEAFYEPPSEVRAKLESFFSRPPWHRPQVTGITFLARRLLPQLGQPMLRFLTGRLFRDIGADEIGIADLIVDLYGVLSYDPDLWAALQKVLNVLRPGGVALIFPADFGKARIWQGRQWLSVADFLALVPGLKVEKHGSFEEQNEFLRITRTEANDIRVPPFKLRFSFPRWKYPEPRSYIAR